LVDSRERLGLDAETDRLLDRYHTDFVRAGAELAEPDKERLRGINEELPPSRRRSSRTCWQIRTRPPSWWTIPVSSTGCPTTPWPPPQRRLAREGWMAATCSSSCCRPASRRWRR